MITKLINKIIENRNDKITEMEVELKVLKTLSSNYLHTPQEIARCYGKTITFTTRLTYGFILENMAEKLEKKIERKKKFFF